jgi:RNA polymerase sigma-70 factor, ECF subfamily
MELRSTVVSIENATTGPALSVERAVTRYLDELYRFALHMTRDPDRAQELAQECIFRALKNRGRITKNPKAWLFQTLYNAFVSEYRRQLSHKTFDDQTETLISESEILRDPLPEFIAVRDVRTAIEGLSEDLRAVIWLSDAEEFRLREIAEILELPLGTVASKLFRARRELRRSLSAYGSLEEKNL